MSENGAPSPHKKLPFFIRLFNRFPPTIQKSISVIRVLLKPIVAIIALNATLYILHTVAFIPNMVLGAESQEVSTFFSVQTSDYATNPIEHTYGIPISGTTTPYATIVFGIHDRQLGDTRANRNGDFSERIYLPIASQNDLWVRAFDRDQLAEEGILKISLPEELNTPPSIALATYIPELDRVWISGFGIPYENIQLLIDDVHLEEFFTVDQYGVFDILINWEGIEPEKLIVEYSISNSPLQTEPVSISVDDLADLPLSRQTKAVLADEPNTIDVQVGLPIEHPYFYLMAEGFISPESFIHMTTGSFPRAEEYDHDIRIENGIGNVSVRGEYSSPIPGFYLYQYVRDSIRGSGLLTEKDSVLIDYGSFPVSWINPPSSQSNIGEGVAIWTGPLARTENQYLIDIGFINPKAQPYLPSSEIQTGTEEGVETGDIFARRTEQYYFEEFPRITWSTLLSLIPYFGVYWIIKRYRFTKKRYVWFSLIDLTLILAILKNWGYFHYLFNKGPHVWVGGQLSSVRYFFRLYPQNTTIRNLYYGGDDNAFWFTLLFLVAIIPLAYPFLIRKSRSKFIHLSWSPISWTKRLAYSLRLALFIIATLIFIFSFSLYIDVGDSYTNDYESNIREADNLGLRIKNIASEDDLRESLKDVLPLDRFAEVEAILTRLDPNLEFNTMDFFVDKADWILIFYALLPLIQAIILILIFVSVDFSLAIFGSGLAIVLARIILAQPVFYQLLDNLNFYGLYIDQEILKGVEKYLSWPTVIIIAGLFSYPLIAKFVKWLLPKIPRLRLLTFFITITLILITLGAPLIPQSLLLLVASLLVLTVFIWLIIVNFRRFSPFINVYRQLRQIPIQFYVIVFLLGLVVVRPIDNDQPLYLDQIIYLFSQVDNLFFYVLLLAIAIMMRQFAQNKAREKVEKIAIENSYMISAGIIFFSIFVIKSTNTTFLIPIPFLVALLIARFWLLMPSERAEKVNACLNETSGKRQAFIQDILIADRVASQLGKLNKAFSKNPTNSEIEEAYQKLKRKLTYREKKIRLETDGFTARDTVFAYGEKNLWDNALSMIYFGLVLALIPFSLFLYEFLPNTEIRYPYPLTNILITMFEALASWVIYAFFFGYFYPNIRGRTGLSKGLVMFVAVVVPFALYRILETQSLEEMASFFLWALQIFLFFTLLGLISDLRILQKTRHKARDILIIHNWPAISAYVSTVIAAVPTISTLFNLEIKTIIDLFAEFFSKIILGGG